jgi:glycosyltransferase involved in cell wall biosynthesis
MKIFLIIPSLGTGGAERVGVLLANGFCKRGYEVAVFSNLQMRQDYKLEDGIDSYDIGTHKNKILKWLYAVKRVRQLSQKRKPDVVIGVMSLCSLIGYIATIGMNIPVIETIHSSLEKPNYAPMLIWEKFYKFYLSKIYNVVTVLTKADRIVLKGSHNIVSMPNPLSLEPMESILPPRKKIIFAAGRMDDWHYKGFDVLIRAWARIVSSFKFQSLTPNPSPKGDGNYGWKLQIAGTGSEESLNYLKQLCKENGVEDSVEFLGFRKDVEKLYRDTSVFVLSSRYEGFGLVLIEAMSQGCACVACDYKGRQREILNPANDQPSETRNLNPETLNRKFEACDNGILCEPDNVDALADAMVKLITDDDYRESVRKNAIERSKYYSIENTIDRWEKLLDEVVN